MKLFKILLAAAVLFYAGEALAQSKKVKKENKTVEFKNDNGKKSLVIITNEDGKVRKEEYTGEEAERRMEEMNAADSKEHYKVFINDDEDTGDHGNVHVFNEDGDVSVIHKDGKVVIKSIDKNGKEEVEEIDLGKLEDSFKGMRFAFDSDSFDFKFDNHFNMADFEKRMEKLGEEIEMKVGEGYKKAYVFHGLGEDADKGKVVVKEEEETLTAEQIKEKYGVEVNGDEKVIIKKVIKVKNETSPANKEILREGDVKVFPNPGNGEYNLMLNAPKGGVTVVEIKDGKGSTVYTSEFTVKGVAERKLDLRHLPAGNYTLTIRNNGKVSTEQLIKE